MPRHEPVVAYFSMEIALEPGIPTYAGGLGVLAGDTLRSAADLRIPLVGVTLLSRYGYFRQRLDPDGQQHEEPVGWNVEKRLRELPVRTWVLLEGRRVEIRGWQYDIQGAGGHTVPVYLLDTDLPDNKPDDRALTHWLYGGDRRYRLCQEVVLGIGGVRLLRALGYEHIHRFHMNEGHSALLTLELLDEQAARAGRHFITMDDVELVRQLCVFTTHTPVPAGHDRFPMDLVERVLGRRDVYQMHDVFCCEGVLNLTYLGLNLSHYVNGVAKRHGLVSRQMFGRYIIDAITNGVHVPTWTGAAFTELFDRHIPGWREDNYSLRYALGIPSEEIWQAHVRQKQQLLQAVAEKTGVTMSPEVLTLGFARRMTMYKRPMLLFHDTDRLAHIAAAADGLQIIYAGKAHPQDDPGKELIRQIFSIRKRLADGINLVFLPDYDIELARLVTGGVDVWINTPEPPLEASGTSGMKAAINGIPSLSVLDGWWLEGCIEGVTGWSVGEEAREPQLRHDGALDAASLYDKLEQQIVPTYLRFRDQWINVMRHAIALNGAFFNTQRMLSQYVVKAYFG